MLLQWTPLNVITFGYRDFDNNKQYAKLDKLTPHLTKFQNKMKNSPYIYVVYISIKTSELYA